MVGRGTPRSDARCQAHFQPPHHPVEWRSRIKTSCLCQLQMTLTKDLQQSYRGCVSVDEQDEADDQKQEMIFPATCDLDHTARPCRNAYLGGQ